MREEARDWTPFKITADGRRAEPPRALCSREGVGDRLRTAAMAELQAREAFLWAAARFEDAPEGLRPAWRSLAAEEDRHLGWLLGRMAELGVDPAGREVSDRLWRSLTACRSARDFAELIASAEERGRVAGEGFGSELAAFDPATASIFARIAEEEIAHIALARGYFPAEAAAG